MNKLRYKDFAWQQNPHTFREVYIREPIFVTENKVAVYRGMGQMQRIISGEGAFFGPGAYNQFRELAARFQDGTAGTLAHPVWGARYCYFTRLELTQAPEEEAVSYAFVFTVALEDGTVPV